MYWYEAESPVGALMLTGNGALSGVHFQAGPHPLRPARGWRRDAAPFADALRQLEEYFHGERRTFQLPLAPVGTPFQLAVWLALQAVPATADIVIVHDAVRPLITRGLIDAVVAAVAESGAAICALPITETVKRVRQEVVEATLDRSELWAVQTPQAFRAALLREAHEKARRDGVIGTDDAMLVERLGHRVRVVRGLAENVKITTPEDLRRARRAWAR